MIAERDQDTMKNLKPTSFEDIIKIEAEKNEKETAPDDKPEQPTISDLSDAAEAILDEKPKRLLKMLHGAGWVTGSGVKFTKEHPFQLVNELERGSLIKTGRFRDAGEEELKEFYQVD